MHPNRVWRRLGEPAPHRLVDVRLQLHWAAQIVASVGYTFIPPEPDYGHLSLTWIDEPGLLASRLTPGDRRFRAALRLADLTLLLLHEDGRILGEHILAGGTLDEGYQWLGSAITTLTGRTTPLVRPDHTMPRHRTGEGALFSLAPPEAFSELARWYADADLILQALGASAPNASPVRCWPHHFDLATLLSFDAGQDPEKARSIGVGLTPGDDSDAEPYWYVLPWPPPRDAEFPPLEGRGGWHTEGWTGAKLPASTLVDAGTAEAQEQRARAFVQSGVAACRRLLGLGA